MENVGLAIICEELAAHIFETKANLNVIIDEAIDNGVYCDKSPATLHANMSHSSLTLIMMMNILRHETKLLTTNIIQ